VQKVPEVAMQEFNFRVVLKKKIDQQKCTGQIPVAEMSSDAFIRTVMVTKAERNCFNSHHVTILAIAQIFLNAIHLHV
jgi:hypothetical protein